MAPCAHEHLQLEETAAHYRCVTCGLQVVVLRVEEPPEAPAVTDSSAPEESPAPSGEIDVPGHIKGFVPAQRRLPSKIKR
jgi:hypothetical protein